MLTSLDAINDYVELHNITNTEFKKLLIKLGNDIIDTVKRSTKETDLSTGKTFDGKIKSISIENFLGVQDEITFDFSKMRDGVWFIEGENGSGKSTILEGM